MTGCRMSSASVSLSGWCPGHLDIPMVPTSKLRSASICASNSSSSNSTDPPMRVIRGPRETGLPSRTLRKVARRRAAEASRLRVEGQ